LAAHKNTVWAIAFSPDGKTLASGSQDQKVKLWQVETGQLLCTLDGHDKAVLSVAFSPDSQTLASSSYDKKIHLWDVDTEEILETFKGHAKPVWSVNFSPDGQTLASGGADQTIKLWSMSALSNKQLQNTTASSAVVEVVASEITDQAKLEELNQKLYDRINQSWQKTPVWYEDLLFCITVNADGAIAKLEMMNEPANKYAEQTPLPKLFNTAKSEITEQKSVALFRVVMTPTGVLEVSPWSGWL
ncbi:MAG: WD40 repeat domain-containing protein, partial [Okeania sp. SIO3C4]|nr:WD40 repeat domain-containing protein [Okeania sp. SIO3C4]